VSDTETEEMGNKDEDNKGRYIPLLCLFSLKTCLRTVLEGAT